jgi:hypothetical protein
MRGYVINTSEYQAAIYAAAELDKAGFPTSVKTTATGVIMETSASASQVLAALKKF